MMHRRLRRRIGVGALGLRHRPHHRAEVDDCRRPIGGGGGEQQRRQVARQREQAGDVDRHHPLPRLPRIGRERRAPRDSGVVDQDVQPLGARAHRGGERRDAGLVGHRAAEALAGTDRRQFARRRFARLGLARGDEHARGRIVGHFHLEGPRESRGGDVERQALERNAASQVDAPDGSWAAIHAVCVAFDAFGGERARQSAARRNPLADRGSRARANSGSGWRDRKPPTAPPSGRRRRNGTGSPPKLAWTKPHHRRCPERRPGGGNRHRRYRSRPDCARRAAGPGRKRPRRRCPPPQG